MEIDENFNLISNEIRRQYNLQIQLGKELDLKIQVVLGFIFLSAVGILTSQEIHKIISSNVYSFVIFIFSGYFIIGSILFGFKAYGLRKYGYGGDISSFILQYKNGEKRDFNKAISRKIYDSLLINRKNIASVGQIFIYMFTFFLIGIMILFILILWVTLQNVR